MSAKPGWAALLLAGAAFGLFGFIPGTVKADGDPAQALPAAEAAPAPEPRTIPGEFIIEPPTLHCISFRWEISGDDNRNGSVTMEYRQTGESDWRPALPLFRVNREAVYYQGITCGNLYAGSILALAPDTEYEARLRLFDPDGGKAEKAVTARTRPVPAAAADARQLHVYPAAWRKKQIQPAFASVAQACEAASPGDLILIHAGIYSEDFSFTRSGAPGRPIVLRGAGDGAAVFAGKRRANMVHILGASHLWFENITFKNPGSGNGYVSWDGCVFRVEAGPDNRLHSEGLVLRNCRFEEVGAAIAVTDPQSRNFYIADNAVIGRNPAGMHIPYDERKKTLRADRDSGIGIIVCGQGHVICHNLVMHFWDGIDFFARGAYPENRAAPATELISAIDIHNNDIRCCADDFLQADGGSHNIRVWENRGFNSGAWGLSAQPVYGGPVYFVRNVLYNMTYKLPGAKKDRPGKTHFEGNAFKMNTGPAGVVAYHNTAAGNVSADWLNSNTHFRNNLLLAPYKGGSLTSYSSFDYNGYRPEADQPLFEWRRVKSPDSLRELSALAQDKSLMTSFPQKYMECVKCATLDEVRRQLGFEEHGLALDYDIFEQAEKPAPDRVYQPDEMRFDLKPGAGAIDAGVRLATVNDDYAGRAPDLGAYELGRPPPAYGPRAGAARGGFLRAVAALRLFQWIK